MKNLSILFQIFILFSSNHFLAQTKMISYKSHSGDMKFFEKSIIENRFSTNFSNLGAAPQRYIVNSKLDSVIIIDDEKSVMITSKFCHNRRSENLEKWKPGRDTVYNHPVFSNQDIDEAKKVLKRDYYFQNDIDSTVFLKYDSKTKEYKPISTKRTVKKAEIKTVESTEKFLYILVLSIAVLSSVFVYRKYRKSAH